MGGHFTVESTAAHCRHTCSEHDETPRLVLLNAEPTDKLNKKSFKLCNENVKNLQHFETQHTADGVI